MIENQSVKVSYTWLTLITILSTFTMFSAGFDHNVVFFGVILMTSFILITMLATKEQLQVNELIITFLIFMAWSFISLFWSISQVRTVIEGIQLISFALVYLLARKLSSEELDKLIKVLFIVTGGIAVLGLLEYVFISGNRIQSVFTNPNPFGIYMVMMFLVSLSLAIRKQSKAINVLSVLLLSVVFLSGSRASMGALLFALIIVFFGIDKKNLKKSIVKATIVLFSAYALSQILIYLSLFIRENVFIDKSLLESITRSSSFVTSSLKGRLEFWRVAFDLFKNKPIIGYGHGTYFSAYYIEYGMNEWYSRFTHNHYLQILSELGIVGTMLFLGFLWTGFKAVVYNSKLSNKPLYFWGMVAGLVAFILHIGVDFTWNFPAVTALFFFFLGVTTMEDKRKSLRLNRTVSIVGLVFIILITCWQLGSSKLYLKALNLEQTDSTESALNLTQRINEVYPISSFGWSYESDLLYKRYLETNNPEDLDEAFVAAKNALKRSPYDSGISIKLAKLYHYEGDYDYAEKHYLNASKYSAYTLNSFIELSKMYIEMGKKDKAVDTLLLALDRAPFAITRAPGATRESTVDSVAIIHVTLANLFNEVGEIEKVKEHVQHLIALKEIYPFLEKYFN